ncbi:hypothetical protein EZV62_002205 [Acer yangbiense]|uniref:Uncharacterized protein n=1 Tax=Acer yangbiense TaxID=1000413 RepID=A0A5C7IYU9_9ROSI|nr:hypothetical protein EZV62_002205 [Acer yangbiense]
MKALLSQQKILKTIEGPDKLPDSLTVEEKDDMLEMALGTIILNLSKNILREVNDETTAFNFLKKLESLYLTKSLTDKIYLKERDNEKSSDENEAIILLNSLPDSFKNVKTAIKYGRSSLTLEECISALQYKDLELKIEKNDGGENLFARGRH